MRQVEEFGFAEPSTATQKSESVGFRTGGRHQKDEIASPARMHRRSGRQTKALHNAGNDPCGPPKLTLITRGVLMFADSCQRRRFPAPHVKKPVRRNDLAVSSLIESKSPITASGSAPQARAKSMPPSAATTVDASSSAHPKRLLVTRTPFNRLLRLGHYPSSSCSPI